VYLSRAVDAAPSERVRALRANRLGVDIVLSVCIADENEQGVFYFASDLSSSRAGEALAGSIAERLDLPLSGRAIPILKNTRSPAVVIAVPGFTESTTASIVQGLLDLYITDWTSISQT
jgi:hypothetical protein